MLPIAFPPIDPRCHSNEIWDKIGDNSAYVRDNYEIFGYVGDFRRWAKRIFPRATLDIRQRNLGHSGLDHGLRNRYIEDLCVRWGVFEVGLF